MVGTCKRGNPVASKVVYGFSIRARQTGRELLGLLCIERSQTKIKRRQGKLKIL